MVLALVSLQPRIMAEVWFRSVILKCRPFVIVIVVTKLGEGIGEAPIVVMIGGRRLGPGEYFVPILLSVFCQSTCRFAVLVYGKFRCNVCF